MTRRKLTVLALLAAAVALLAVQGGSREALAEASEEAAEARRREEGRAGGLAVAEAHLRDHAREPLAVERHRRSERTVHHVARALDRDGLELLRRHASE